MNITTSSSATRTAAQSEARAAAQAKLRKNLIVGGSAAALGTGMVFHEAIGNSLSHGVDSFQSALAPAMPVLAGIGVGAFAGAITGTVYGMIATSDKHDAEPLFATIGGGIGGLVVGGVAGGIAAACGVTPLLGIPAVIIGGLIFQSRM